MAEMKRKHSKMLQKWSKSREKIKLQIGGFFQFLENFSIFSSAREIHANDWFLRMSVLNYSKWDNIEISDDEDDTHPNIHTPSLFKWRHEARVQRMQELEVEKERVSEGKKETEAALKRAKTAGHTTEDLEKQLKDWKLKVNMIHRPWLIDYVLTTVVFDAWIRWERGPLSW